MITNLLNEIPIEQFEISEKIITFSEKYLKTKLSSSIHITLADHISFTILRVKKGYNVKNPLLIEIQNLYEHEYVIGLYALDLIKKELDIDLPEDEAGYIVMHIIEAQMNKDSGTVSSIIKLTEQIKDMIKNQFGIPIDEDTPYYGRLITHLKFFAQRVIKGELGNSIDKNMIDLFIQSYPESYNMAEKISRYIESNYNYNVDNQDIFYLALHLQRCIQKL